MKALSLFSGIGGIDLACEWAGIETVAFCEREPFPQRVLKKHWPNVPIYDDVCTLTKERLDADGIGTIELIHGGYPCQPFSHAGQRKSKDDDRYLWPEVLRLIQTIKPRWFVGENVAGHVTLGLDTVLSELDSIGYSWEAFVIPASAVNAPHRRDRVFIVAHAECGGWSKVVLPHHAANGGQTNKGWAAINAGPLHGKSTWEKWEVESGVLGIGDGFSKGLDRLKALGNAVVPQQIYPILAAIKQIDDMLDGEA
jgi:DNA (cytosine-5)-methyltransferase 1